MRGELVHKWAEAMVAFEAEEVTGAGTTALRARHPLSFTYSGRDLGWRDPLQLAEVLRQAVIASVHVLASPPVGAAFVMERMQLAVTPGAFEGDRDYPVVLHTSDPAPRARAAGSSRIVTNVQFRRGDATFATGIGHLRIVSRGSYERLRGDGARALSAELETTIAAPLELSAPDAAGRRSVRFDPHDPFFFDHPVDHIPGMLLFEAVRMAAADVAPAGTAFVSFDGVFTRFVELDEPASVLVEFEPGPSSPRARFEVAGLAGAVAACGYLEFGSASR